ncbi:MAG: tetratricopeptide repeat protein [Betaproteobacteria bacterium]|nr:tetratricopeptide repeat protein [Betaproteobacteria bacterium]
MADGDYADWLQRGRAHQWQGRPVDAMLCFRRAAALAPDAADPRFLLGEVQWTLGAVTGAVEAWRDAVRIDPAHLASQLALAEASMALGELGVAAGAARAARELAPDDPGAIILDSVSGYAVDRDPGVLADLVAVLRAGPGRLASPAVAGTLAHALRGATDGVAVRTLAEAMAPHAGTLAIALLEPLARAAFAADASEPLRAARPAVIAAALERPIGATEIDVLREVALALAEGGEAEAGARVAARYAEACLALVPPAAPLRWPRRAAGDALRVVVLLPRRRAEDALALLARCADAVRWTLLADPRAPTPSGVPAGAVVRTLHRADAEVAAALAADDPDLLLDFAGLDAATGPLLALRPAQQAVGVSLAAPPHAPPLVDEVVAADAAALRALVAEHAGRKDARGASPLRADELAAAQDRAIALHRGGDLAAAREGYERLLEAQPGHAPTLHLLAALLREQKDDDGAARTWRRALDSAPGFVDARAALARLARDRGRHDEAAALVDEGLERAPRSTVLWRVRGDVELARGDVAAAQAAYGSALALAPTDAEAHYNVGVAHQRAGELNEAARAWQRALAFDPGFADAHFNLGVLFQQSGRDEAAVSAYRAVLARDRRHVAAYRNLGEALLATGRVDEFLAGFGRFEANCPDALPLAVQALEACHYAADFARVEHYLEGLRKERFRARDAAELVESLEQLAYLLLFFDVEPEMAHRFAQTYDRTAPLIYGEPLPRTASRRPGKLRIGYLSADLRNHVMGKMMWQPIGRHDRSRFALHFYSLSRTRDAWTAKFAGVAERFEVIAGLPEREAALRIAADDLDLLVDLSGHTKGGKPGILALKPARVQIEHVASAGSVGLSTVDFKLTDAFADVPENQAWTIERLLPMEGCVYPHRRIEAAKDHPFHRAALDIPRDAVVIGAFVAPLKLSRRCLTLWRDVLARIPRARLAFSPANPAFRPVYERLAAAAGIARERLVFLPQGRDDAESQARYALVDFVLDPTPFGNVNGALEPLEAGVPVVTLLGKRHGERTAYSILANLGVTQTVAHSGRDYIEIAARLADDPAFMREVREAIRAGLAVSPLVDATAHARHLEAAYLAALRERAPEALAAAGDG